MKMINCAIFFAMAMVSQLCVASEGDLIVSYQDAIVQVKNTVSQEIGTGLIIGLSKNSFIVLTANHVVEDDSKNLEVVTRDGIKSDVHINFSNKATDLATLTVIGEPPGSKIDPTGRKLFAGPSIGRTELAACDLNDPIHILGFPPGSKSPRIFESKIINKTFKGRNDSAEIDGAKVQAGMSGGLAINSNGEVIGVVVEVESKDDGLSIARMVKVGSVMDFLKKNNENGNTLVRNVVINKWVLSPSHSNGAKNIPQLRIKSMGIQSLPGNFYIDLSESGAVGGMIEANYCISRGSVDNSVFAGNYRFNIVFDHPLNPNEFTSNLNVPAPNSNNMYIPMSFNSHSKCRGHVSSSFNFGPGSSTGGERQLTLECEEGGPVQYRLQFTGRLK